MVVSVTIFPCYSFTGAGNFCLVHVSLVPVLNVVGEQVSELLSQFIMLVFAMLFCDLLSMLSYLLCYVTVS
jgi:hypothetical protein